MILIGAWIGERKWYVPQFQTNTFSSPMNKRGGSVGLFCKQETFNTWFRFFKNKNHFKDDTRKNLFLKAAI